MPVTTMDLGSGSGTLEWYGFRQPLDSNGSNQGTQPNCERVHSGAGSSISTVICFNHSFSLRSIAVS